MPPAHRGTTVLVVEDDADVRAMYRTALQLNGYVVVAVEDGVDALRHIEDSPPAVVVLDLGLPRLGGRDVQREVAGRADLGDIPIIVVTGSEAPDLDPRAFACILHKPIDADALVAAVRRCLDRLHL